MEVVKIRAWLETKLESEDSIDKDVSQEAIRYLDAVDALQEELDNQIELSGSEIVKAILEHVRDDIIYKHLEIRRKK